jgi:hypothetical protein
MTNALLQTITFRIGVDVTDKSRRADHSAQFGYSTGGDFTKYERLLAPAGAFSVFIPLHIIYILTAGSAISVEVTWGGVNPCTRIFKVNKFLFLSDMTDITTVTITNNSIPTTAAPALSESIRVLTL